MSLTVITPTRNRPLAFELCERWMARQHLQPDQWIVMDSSDKPVTCHMNQTHVVTQPGSTGSEDLARKVQFALNMAQGDFVAFIEDDDWYAPEHLASLVEYLEHGYLAAGTTRQYYYNLKHRNWIWLKNIGSCLCSTGFERQMIPWMVNAAEQALTAGNYNVDRNFWHQVMNSLQVRHCLYDHGHYVGMKGLPGSTGLGHGHRPDPRWKSDPHWHKLHEWLGPDDAKLYIEMWHEHFGDQSEGVKKTTNYRDRKPGMRYSTRL